ncbi:hypothetical protein E0H94_13365 [Acinetobacter sp. ANC 4173]|nr:hypothetical protein [Acinetobacter sp. ANC 4173]TCB78280.1 hypothetical protein E0H94_13365 [Acinetobacter sp. ANC 4173]
MKNKAPNKIIAPIIITGITVRFFVRAYKFICAKPKTVVTTQIWAETLSNAATAGSDAEESTEKIIQKSIV